jgi:hypothetical protein
MDQQRLRPAPASAPLRGNWRIQPQVHERPVGFARLKLCYPARPFARILPELLISAPAHTRLIGLAFVSATAPAFFGGAAPYAAYLFQTWSGATSTPGIMIAVVATVLSLILRRLMPGRTAPATRQN